jgi:hypothetical protein
MSDYEKLEGAGTAGDFVLENQGLATKQGFGHVSKKWYDQTMSYDEGLEKLAVGRQHTSDITATLSAFAPAVDDQGNFVMSYGERNFRPTGHALGQMGVWAKTGTWFPRSLTEDAYDNKDRIKYQRDAQDSECLAEVFRNSFRRLDQDKEFLFRTRDDGTLRAMLSDRYAVVDNSWFVNVIKGLIPSGRLSHWKGDSDTIYGNVLIPDTIREEEDSDYGGMFSIGNCEIGVRSISTCPSVFRAICMNGCIWDQEMGVAIRKVHRGEINLEELKETIKLNLEEQIPLLPEGIERLLAIRAKGTDGASMSTVFASVAKDHKLSKKQATSTLVAYNHEPHQSLFGVVNAVTRAGQTLKNNEDWLKFDRLGGRLSQYSDSDWSSLLNRANSLKEKDVLAVFNTNIETESAIAAMSA